jgi:hypothetical protein
VASSAFSDKYFWFSNYCSKQLDSNSLESIEIESIAQIPTHLFRFRRSFIELTITVHERLFLPQRGLGLEIPLENKLDKCEVTGKYKS